MSAATKPAAALIAAVSLGFMTIMPAFAQEQFDLSLLENSAQLTLKDAEILNGESELLPGKYHLKVFINQHEVADQEILFDVNRGRTEPRFACRDLQEWGMQIEACPQPTDFLSAWVPAATFDLDMGDNKLTITVPQEAWSQPNFYDVAPPWKWENGINAAFVNYDLYVQHYKNKGASDNSFYGNLTNGMNMAGLRLRNSGFFTASHRAPPVYRSSASWLAYDIDRLRSTFTLGDFYTSGRLFRSVAMRGASLATNMAMFSNMERSYIPAIIGYVSTNATVIIRQNDYVIATRQIPPGTFNINDIPLSSSAGDIDVTILEASGHQQHFIQPFNTSSFLVPPHRLRYALNMGRERLYHQNALVEANLLYGLNNTFTLLNGLQHATDYDNLASGLGANIRWLGGVNILLNHSRNTKPHQSRAGNQLQAGLSRFLALTDSYLYATVTRRLEPGYQDLNETRRSENALSDTRFRNKYSLQLNQNIKEMNLAFNYTQQNDWNGNRSRFWQTNLNLRIGHSTLLTAFSRRYMPHRAHENYLSVSISIPLGHEQRNYLDVSQSAGASANSHLALSGQAGKDRALNYSFGATKSGSQQHYDASTSYSSGSGIARATWSQSQSAQQWTAGLRGTVVAHHHGVTLGQTLSESAAIIHTDRIRDLGIENIQRVKTDRWGNAVVPSLAPYYYNELTPALDHQHMHTVKVDETVHRRVPRQGAIVEVEFNAAHQQQHYARIMQDNQQPLPFGAVLYDAENHNRGIISAGGMTSMDIYQLKWPLHINLSNEQHCNIDRPAEQTLQQKVWRLVCHA